MTELLYILLEISLPIILLIGIGFGFQKIFKADTKLLIKLLVYLITPVLIFVKIYESDITLDAFLNVLPFVVLLIVCMTIIALILSRIFRYKKSMRNATINSLVLINSGNYGLPLIELSFPANPLATMSQLFVIMIQSFTGSTVGVFNACTGNATKRQAWKNMLKMPWIYAILLAVLLKSLNVTMPSTVMVPLGYIASAYISVALITLGVQLAMVRLGSGLRDVLTVSLVRVLIAPLIGFGLVLLLGIKGVLAQALIIGTSTPTAVNSAMLAQEFKNEPDFAAKTVLMTTVFVTFTLPLIIWFVRMYF